MVAQRQAALPFSDNGSNNKAALRPRTRPAASRPSARRTPQRAQHRRHRLYALWRPPHDYHSRLPYSNHHNLPGLSLTSPSHSATCRENCAATNRSSENCTAADARTKSPAEQRAPGKKQGRWIVCVPLYAIDNLCFSVALSSINHPGQNEA